MHPDLVVLANPGSDCVVATPGSSGVMPDAFGEIADARDSNEALIHV